MEFSWIGVAGFFVGSILPFVLASVLPNKWFKTLGVKAGRDLSRMGRRLIGPDSYEKFENTLTGSLVSFAQGVAEGADEDDSSGNV